MRAKFEQVYGGRWPSGGDKALAILRLNRESWSAGAACGSHQELTIWTNSRKPPSGRPMLLMRYRQSPNPGTTVRVDELDDAKAALDEMCKALIL